MRRLLYEHSVSAFGHLIIPFAYTTIDGNPIYSYQLLSALGHRGKFHQADNPAKVYAASISEIVKIAKEHLKQDSDLKDLNDYFKHRYIYLDNLIIVHKEAGKYFYDHYQPDNLTNIAAPRIFTSEDECVNWIQQGLNRR